MKRVAAMLMVTMLLLPGAAWAGSSTDAALGLGAFAVFNQILSGTGIFGGGRTVVVERPVVVAPPPVVYAPPPPVHYAPPPVVYAPPPPAVVYAPAPRVVYGPPVVYEHAPRHGDHAYRRWESRRAAWCPPGLARQGRCDDGWAYHYPR